MVEDKKFHLSLWWSLIPILGWSAIGCYDPFTWFLEVLPVILGMIILAILYPKFHLTNLVYWFLWIHAIVLMVGGHYTYAEVPLFNWIRDHFDLARNHYDRVGHFMQGFAPAMLTREILIRAKVINKKGWLFFIVASICLAFSATYELFEWIMAVLTGTKADAFLGSQGDVWDSQWDMAFALIGAITSLLFLSRSHDRQLTQIQG